MNMTFFKSLIFVLLTLSFTRNLLGNSYQICLGYASSDQTVTDLVGTTHPDLSGYTVYSLGAGGWHHYWDKGVLNRVNSSSHRLRSKPLVSLKRGQGYILRTDAACDEGNTGSTQNLKFLNDGWILFGFGNSNTIFLSDLTILDKEGKTSPNRLLEALIFVKESGQWMPVSKRGIPPYEPVLLRAIAETQILVSPSEEIISLAAAPHHFTPRQSISMSELESEDGPQILVEVYSSNDKTITGLEWQVSLDGVIGSYQPATGFSPSVSTLHHKLLLPRFTGDAWVRVKATRNGGTNLESEWLKLRSNQAGWNLSQMFDLLKTGPNPSLSFSLASSGSVSGVLPAGYPSARIQNINLSLSGADFSTRSFQFSGAETSARIPVPFGNERKIDLSYYDDSGDLLRRGTKVFQATQASVAITPEPVPTGLPQPVASVASMAFLSTQPVSFSLSEALTNATLVIMKGLSNPKSLESTQSLIRVTTYSEDLTQSTTFQIFVEMADGRRGGTFSYHYVKTEIPQVIAAVSGLLPETDTYFAQNAQLVIHSNIPGSRIFYTQDGSIPTINSPNGISPLSLQVSQSTTFRYFAQSPFGYMSSTETKELKRTVIPEIQVLYSNSRSDGRFLDSLALTFSSNDNLGFVRIANQNRSLPHSEVVSGTGILVYEPVSLEGFLGSAISLNLQKITTPYVHFELNPYHPDNTFVGSALAQFMGEPNLRLYYSTNGELPTLSSANILLPVTFTVSDSIVYKYFVEDSFGFVSPLETVSLSRVEPASIVLETIPENALIDGFDDFVIVRIMNVEPGHTIRYTFDPVLPVEQWLVLGGNQIVVYDSTDLRYQVLDATSQVVYDETLVLNKIEPISTDLSSDTVYAQGNTFSFNVPTAIASDVLVEVDGTPISFSSENLGDLTRITVSELSTGSIVRVAQLDQDDNEIRSRTVSVVQPKMNSFFESDPFGLRHEYYNQNSHGTIASVAYDHELSEIYFMSKGVGRVMRLDNHGVLHSVYNPHSGGSLFGGFKGTPLAVSNGKVFRILPSLSNGTPNVLIQYDRFTEETLDLSNASSICTDCVDLSDIVLGGEPHPLNKVSFDLPYIDPNTQSSSIYSMQVVGNRLYFLVHGILMEADLQSNTLQSVAGNLGQYVGPDNGLSEWNSIADFAVTLERAGTDSLLLSTITSSAQLGFYMLVANGVQRGNITTHWFMGPESGSYDPNQPVSFENFPVGQVNGVNVIVRHTGTEIYLKLEQELVKIDPQTQTIEPVVGFSLSGFSDQIPARLSQMRRIMGDIYSANDRLVVGFINPDFVDIPATDYAYFGIADPDLDTINPLFRNTTQGTSGMLRIDEMVSLDDGSMLLEYDSPTYQLYFKRHGISEASNDDSLLRSPHKLSGLYPVESSMRMYTVSSVSHYGEFGRFVFVDLASSQSFFLSTSLTDPGTNPITLYMNLPGYMDSHYPIEGIDWLDVAYQNQLGLSQILVPANSHFSAYLPGDEFIYYLLRQASGDYVLYRASLANPELAVEKIRTYFSGQIPLANNETYTLDFRGGLRTDGTSLFIINEGSLIQLDQTDWSANLIFKSYRDTDNQSLAGPVRSLEVEFIKKAGDKVYILASQASGSRVLALWDAGRFVPVMPVGFQIGYEYLFPQVPLLSRTNFHGRLTGSFPFQIPYPRIFDWRGSLLVLGSDNYSSAGFILDLEGGDGPDTPVINNVVRNGNIVTASRSESDNDLLGYAASTEISYNSTQVTFLEEADTSSYRDSLFEGLVAIDSLGRRSTPSFAGVFIPWGLVADLSPYLSQSDPLSVPSNFSTTINANVNWIQLVLPSFTYRVHLRAVDAYGNELAHNVLETDSQISHYHESQYFSTNGLIVPGAVKIVASVDSFSGTFSAVEFDLVQPYWLGVMGLEGAGLPASMSNLAEFSKIKTIGSNVFLVPSVTQNYNTVYPISSLFVMDESETINEIRIKRVDLLTPTYIGPVDVTVGNDNYLYVLHSNGSATFILRSIEPWNAQMKTVNVELLVALPLATSFMDSLDDYIILPGISLDVDSYLETVVVRVKTGFSSFPPIGLRRLEVSPGVYMTDQQITSLDKVDNQLYMGLRDSTNADLVVLGLSSPTTSAMDVSFVLENPTSSRGSLDSEIVSSGNWQQFATLGSVLSIVPVSATHAMFVVNASPVNSPNVFLADISGVNPLETPLVKAFEHEILSPPFTRFQPGNLSKLSALTKRNGVFYGINDSGQLIRIEGEQAKVLTPVSRTQVKATTDNSLELQAAHFQDNISRLIGVPDTSWSGNHNPPSNHWFVLSENGEIYYWQVQSGFMMPLEHGFRFLDMKLDAQYEDKVFALDELGVLYELTVETDPLMIKTEEVLRLNPLLSGSTMRFEYAQAADILFYSINDTLYRKEMGQEVVFAQTNGDQFHFDEIFMTNPSGNEIIGSIKRGFGSLSYYTLEAIYSSSMSRIRFSNHKIIFHRHLGKALGVIEYVYGDYLDSNSLNPVGTDVNLSGGMMFSDMPASTIFFTKNQNGVTMAGVSRPESGRMSVLQRIPNRPMGMSLPEVSSMSLIKSGVPDILQAGDQFTARVSLNGCMGICQPVATLFQHPLHFRSLPNHEYEAHFVAGPKEAFYGDVSLGDVHILSENGVHRSFVSSGITFSLNEIESGMWVSVGLVSAGSSSDSTPQTVPVIFNNRTDAVLTGTHLKLFRDGGKAWQSFVPFNPSISSSGIETRSVTLDSLSIQEFPITSNEPLYFSLGSSSFEQPPVPLEIRGDGQLAVFSMNVTSGVTLSLSGLGLPDFSGDLALENCGPDTRVFLPDDYMLDSVPVITGKILEVDANFSGQCRVGLNSHDPSKRSVLLKFNKSESGFVMPKIRVSAGAFTMGAPAGAEFQNSDEALRQVTLTKDFFLGTYEVTQAEWLMVMGSWPDVSPSLAGDNYPAINVSWVDINQVGGFLDQLNTMVGCDISSLPTDLNTRYRPDNLGVGCYRLPTAAEWEYAAKAGTSTLWSFGDNGLDGDPYVWHSGNSSGSYQEVGGKLPNPWGFYDMHGNVAEFVFDRAGLHTTIPRIDPYGPDEFVGPNPEHRGGAYNQTIGFTRSAKPGNGGESNRQNNLGFRLVYTVE